MYNIRLNNGAVPVVIHGWEIPKGAIYNADPAEPFVCLCPSPESYDSYVWRYTVYGPETGWHKIIPPKKIKEPLYDFIVSNHLDDSCAIEGTPPLYDIKVNEGRSRIMIHGWAVPKGAVYNADPKEPFVCLCPSTESYDSYIWRFIRNGSTGEWKKDSATKRIKEALLDFIVKNHLDCTCAIESTPPQYKMHYKKTMVHHKKKKVPVQEKDDAPVTSVEKKKSTSTTPKGVRKRKRKKSSNVGSARRVEDEPKTCIICGQPSFMGTSYCYNCYQRYVEKRKK